MLRPHALGGGGFLDVGGGLFQGAAALLLSHFALPFLLEGTGTPEVSDRPNQLDRVRLLRVDLGILKRREKLLLGMKRAVYHLFKKGILAGETLRDYSRAMMEEDDEVLKFLGTSITRFNQPGSLVFMSAEADPFSKSGGLANVVYELPREMVSLLP